MNNHAMDRSLSRAPAPSTVPDRKTEYVKAKAGWPKTPDGTIDWEAVFETPGTGLTAMLADVGSHEILYKVTATIIRQLFTRKGDEIEVERFLLELTRIVGGAQNNGQDLSETRDAVIDLLRRIKQGRIKKAAAYVAEQKRKAVLGERKNREAQRRDADRKASARNRMMLFGGGGLAAVLLLAGAVAMMLSADPADTGETLAADDAAATAEAAAPAAESWGRRDPTAELTREADVKVAKATGVEYAADGYPLGHLSAENLKELGEHVMTLPPIRFSRNVGGGAATWTLVLPVLSVRDPDLWSSICDWAPSLTEAISGVLVRGVPSTGEVDTSHFRAAGEVAMQLMNQRLGGVMVDDVFLLYDVDRSMFRADAGCALLGEG